MNPTAQVTENQIDLTGDSAHELFPLSKNGYAFRFYRKVDELDEDWKAAQPKNNLYLHIPFLRAIENAPPQRIQFCYLVLFEKGRPFGVAYCQIVNFRTDQSVQDMEGGSKAPGFLKSMGTAVKNKIAKQFQFNLLVCGNLMLTGEHGFCFNSTEIGKRQFVNLLEEALKKTQGILKKQKIKTDGIFIKDIDETIESCNEQLRGQAFREFLFHPNMVLYLRPEWNTFDDYKAALSSKYRVRVKKAIKQGMPFTKVDFSVEQLKTNVHHLYELYRKVMDTAGFNMVVLNENYIVQLKKELGERFRVTGYYIDGELVGYRTNIINHDEVEAHFLGYDASFNREYKLYMNMLLDSLKLGIEEKTERIVFARTAMEIKSSIGAIPEDLHCYIRANNSFANRVLSPVLEYFRPPDDWVQRKPFKDIG